MVSQDNYSRLSAEWIEHLAWFDHQNTHPWYGSGSALFSKSSVFCKKYFVIGPKGFIAVFFLIVALKPYFLIKMIVGQSLKE
jgi:hypothetical protein